MTKQKIFEIEAKHYLPVFGRYPIVLEKGNGAVLQDSDGKKYLDFFAGIAVSILGHNHPALVKAISEQASKLSHCTNYYHTEIQARLVEKLCSLSGLDRVFLSNSGTEAVEGAIKIARKWGSVNGGKFKIISAADSFHGRTLAALTATGQPKFHKGFEPLPAGFEYAKFNDIKDLQNKFDSQTAAVILELVQGEGGINVATQEYISAAAKLCKERGALLIFDEIQTGICRTGKMFCFENYGVKPDIMTLAKGLGGGLPVGAVLCSEAVSSAIHKGDHGSTFGGNPLACAAAVAVLETAEKENLAANAASCGAYLMEKLKKLPSKEVRGKGLLIGMELAYDGGDIVKKCLERGLMINCTAGSVLRFVPPLIINKKDVDEAVKILESVL
ncbi:MAG: aspartate aminotransferase family protein [Elusimicrobium sp.]|jgi:acetylornithine/N-succinyldiaminopimelate aminotransferase|nr:aspartate aminotransferase family protein [Elusimicrobium sp.]